VDHYQGIVIEYLRADRALFLNSEYCIQLDEGTPKKGRNWVCDTVVLDCRSKTILLCEVTYAQRTPALLKRLREWHTSWQEIVLALPRLSKFEPNGATWPIRPWLFIPDKDVEFVIGKLNISLGPDAIFKPLITPLEMVQPWAYRWNRQGEDLKQKEHVPLEYRA
jgi:hypothetical protein